MLRTPLKVGYHGTTMAAATRIDADGFRPSESKFEWLGSGIYFFEDGRGHAETWAREQHPGVPLALIRAEIDLGNCMDLLDQGWREHLAATHEIVIAQHRAAGMKLPVQDLSKKRHGLDCHVLNLACSMLDQVDAPVDTVRAAFKEGDRLYPESALSDRDHVQICVRKSTAIRRVTVIEV